jgi:hypothetical protein
VTAAGSYPSAAKPYALFRRTIAAFKLALMRSSELAKSPISSLEWNEMTVSDCPDRYDRRLILAPGSGAWFCPQALPPENSHHQADDNQSNDQRMVAFTSWSTADHKPT